MRAKIQSVSDLRSELSRLRIQSLEYENDLHQVSEKIKSKFHVPMMIINKISDLMGSLFGKDDDGPAKKEDTDWVTNIFRVGLPVFMNKFIFPKSGFLMKSVVAMVSQKAAKNVNKDVVTDLIDKVTDWIKTPRPKTRKVPVLPDYGIPPDSETF
jgi:hypothetical protein